MSYPVELHGVSKRYNIYDRPVDRLKELLWRNRRCYHREFWALRDLNLQFEKGTMTALLGPNGCGKSTMLQIIAGVLQPTTGSVSVHGRVTAILELGSGFQPEYTGRENAIMYGLILGISQEEMESHMDEIARFAEIGDFLDQPVKTYSSGMVVRLAYACATVVDPDILLVDEALAVGDVRFQKRCLDKVVELREKGKTIIFVTHETTVVEWFCHRAIVINGGKVLADGKVEEMLPLYKKLMDDPDAIAAKVFTAPAAAY
ncbi:MAG: ABC transporter ATP-binding protein [Candidatus Obscuribacterales bacterium]|nr:ABC transporter ATP-binding protein [Candidatus Obscuribacterales bacterium]